jgi:anti-sigma factor RsiW
MSHEPSDQSPPDHEQPSAPTGPSRRQVIAGAGVGLGIAATGALAGAAGGAVLGAGATPAAPASTEGADGVVVAHVVDARTGDIDVYVGEQQVRIRDRSVAARLRSAAPTGNAG